MKTHALEVVTGAFSYTGNYITRRLLASGREVRTLTGHPGRPNPFGDRVKAHPFNFDKPEKLRENLRGATTLYNTYWVRFPRGKITYDLAVENTKILIQAAEEAGVQRIVHISITQCKEDSPFPYFRGKAIVEKEIINSKLSYAIIRPTVVFGLEGILINNIAWILKKFPFFAVPGAGDYLVQPVFVEDVAEIAVKSGQNEENIILDAAGPKIFTFEELVRLVAGKIHRKARIIHVKPRIAFSLTKLLGFWVKDVLLTWDEIRGLMANFLFSERPPAGWTQLEDWLKQNKEIIGTNYASELTRHYR